MIDYQLTKDTENSDANDVTAREELQDLTDSGLVARKFGWNFFRLKKFCPIYGIIYRWRVTILHPKCSSSLG